MMKILAVIGLGLLLLAGCDPAQQDDNKVNAWTASLPAPSADYGTYPTNYQDLIKQNLSLSLKDPYSAVYSNFSKPRKEYVITDANNLVAQYGYSACVEVNAKNSYGAFSGDDEFWFFFVNGHIVQTRDTGNDPLGTTLSMNHSIDCDNGS